jgi:hypothetical protein
MTQPQQEQSAKHTADLNTNQEQLTEAQLADLTDAPKQQTYREEYLRQLRQRSCPGCGDEGDVYWECM